MASRASVGRRQPEPPAPDRHMLAALQSTHQHADAKAGILVAAQGALVGTAGAWNRQAVRAWEHGGWGGAISAGLLVLFALGLSGGVGCLALALWPRLLRPVGPNRFSFVDLARSPAVSASSCPPADPVANPGGEHLELAETVRFLARVAVVKHQSLRGALLFTTAMGLSAGLFLVLRPMLL
ncbi:MAG: hypothetical protein ACJ786_02125 [Catenulispora sp.]